MEISNLLEDLVEEIFCKLPVTSMRAIRLTCKKWNTISKSQIFAEKHISKAAAAASELSVIMVIGTKVFLMGLHNINGIPSINRNAELVRLDNADQVDIHQVFHCDGLLLCSTKQERLVVWNPYWGQTRWIESRYSYRMWDYYAIGYEVMNNTHSHKILLFRKAYAHKRDTPRFAGYEIYDFKYNSWRTLDITAPHWNMKLRQTPRGVSVKGNTYWFGKEKIKGVSLDYLICFDFTRERFGPRLSLPCAKADNAVLSSVREEQLVVLVEQWDTREMEIWVTSEIEPTMVSWSKLFLTMTRSFDYFPFKSFFIHEENKVAVIVDKHKDKPYGNMAYIYGVGGYLREVELGESTVWPRLFFPYVPSSVHIK